MATQTSGVTTSSLGSNHEVSTNSYGGKDITYLLNKIPTKEQNGVSLGDRAFFGNDVRRLSLTGVILAHSIGCLCPPIFSRCRHKWDLISLCRDSQTLYAPPCTVPLRMGRISYIYRVRVNFSGLVCFAQPIEIRKVRNHCTKPVAMETIKQ